MREASGRGLGLLPGIVLFLAVCALAGTILIPFALACFLALLLGSPVDAIHRRLHLPRLLAVLLILVAVLGGLGALVTGVAAQGETFLAGWEDGVVPGKAGESSYKARFQARVEHIKTLLGALDLAREPAATGPAGGREAAEPGGHPAEEHPRLLVPLLEGARSWALSGLGTLVSVGMNLFLIAIFLFFLLLDMPNLLRRLARISGLEEGLGNRLVRQVESRLRRYLGTVTCINLGLGLVVYGALSMMGLEFALLWGAMAGLLNFIPFVGATLAGIPPVLMALIQFPGLGPAAAVLGVYMAIQTLEGYLITPSVVGRLTSINPLALLLAAILWGWLWGPVGLILSSPIMVCVHEIGLQVAYLRPLSIFLARGDGSGLTGSPTVRT